MKQTISLIAAISRHRVIGKDNALPWKLSADLKRFRSITTGKSVLMGRKTFESIGRPLPNRKNIVITRDSEYKRESCIVVHSFEDALKEAGEGEVMVIGGAQIFSEFLPKAKRMYLTFIDSDFEGDAYFPKWDEKDWKQVHRENHVDEGGLKYSFIDLERIS